MTREETVRNLLTELIDMIDNGSQRDLDRADEIGTSIIKLFEQEPCEDTISRQAVLDYIYNDLGLGDEENGKDVERQMELERSYKYVKSLSSVTPQPKTGYWIVKITFPTKLYDEYLKEYECSECYRRIRCTESQLVNYPYCHCGAKMADEQESDW
jgi:hypothetical protein